VAIKYNFPAGARLRKKKDFQLVYAQGKYFVEAGGVLYVLPAAAGRNRMAVAAGKKLGGAVQRNRMKRLMRDVYRHKQHEIKKGFDLIWMARRPLLTARRTFYEQTLWKLLKKARLLS
jgi:ribonuclease P protein component